MSMINFLRNLVGKPDDHQEREVARIEAIRSGMEARSEIQKSREQRELWALDRQYGRRVRGTGVRRSSH